MIMVPEPAAASSWPTAHWAENWRKLWFEQIAFPRACPRSKVEIVHVPYFGPPLVSPVPTVVTIHDLIPLILPAYRGSILVRAYTTLAAISAWRASILLADSESTRRDVVRLLGIAPERVEVTPLAVAELYRPCSPSEIDEIRARYALPPKYLLYLGGFDQRKNLGLLMGALALDSQLPPLVIAGQLPEHDSPFFPDPRRLAMEHLVAERVPFIGWVPEEDKPALYSGAEAFLYPSLYEGFGLPVLEALACGAPVIAAARSSLPELVGDAGILLPPDDARAWAEAISELVSNRGRREELASRARERAAQYTWQKTAALTAAAYRRALETA